MVLKPPLVGEAGVCLCEQVRPWSNQQATSKYSCESSSVAVTSGLTGHVLTTDQECKARPCVRVPFSFLLHLFMNNSTFGSVLASKKICCRCGKIHGVAPIGRHGRVDQCNYHFGRVSSRKGRYLVVLFHLLDMPAPMLFREKWNKVFSSISIC